VRIKETNLTVDYFICDECEQRLTGQYYTCGMIRLCPACLAKANKMLNGESELRKAAEEALKIMRQIHLGQSPLVQDSEIARKNLKDALEDK